MADDFQGQDDQTQVDELQGNEAESQAESIRIGEEEYSLEEAQRLVSLGKIGVEAEERYNTKLDRVWPEFTKTKNEFKELQERFESQPEESAQPQADSNDEMEKAKNVLRELGFVTREEAQNLTQEQYRAWREGEKLLEQTQSLESKYDGSDGRPKANTEELLTYMNETGIKDPEVAYKVRYDRELEEWRNKQIPKKPGLMTETRTQADKQPKEVRPTPDTLSDMIAESLNTRE